MSIEGSPSRQLELSQGDGEGPGERQRSGGWSVGVGGTRGWVKLEGGWPGPWPLNFIWVQRWPLWGTLVGLPSRLWVPLLGSSATLLKACTHDSQLH